MTKVEVRVIYDQTSIVSLHCTICGDEHHLSGCIQSFVFRNHLERFEKRHDHEEEPSR